jgi:flagellar biosynthesis regulator FlaF
MANYNVGTTGIVVTADVEKALQGLKNLKTKISEVNKELRDLKSISSSFGAKSFKFDTTVKDKLKEVNDEYKKTNLYAKMLNAENRVGKGLIQQEKNELARKNLEIKKGVSILNEQKLKQNEINLKRKEEIENQKRIAQEQKNITKETDKSKNSLANMIKNAAKISAVIYAYRMLSRFIGNATAEVASFGENVNLFNVAMRHNNQEAIRFATTISQMYGVNLSNTMKYQGQFMNLAQALGIGTEQAYEMSEALTLLTYDLASLYNWTDDMAYNRLLAGIVGQTKPLRYAGIDVTQQTIQPILDELGINKSVIQLTQQEKVMLRMIAVLRQSQNAQNDYSRTIESLANQMKVWEHQTRELMRWIGALWYQIASKIMPILNGLTMAIKEVVKALAIMLGFNMKDFDFVSGKMEDGLIDVTDGIDGADESLKKLNGSLRKFDEINNISMNQSGGVDLGGLTSSMLLSQALTQEMEKYRAKLSEVSMKAHEIRDTIMRWLGFTKNVNEETGEIYFTNVKLEKLMTDVGNVIKYAWDNLVGFYQFITSDTPAANLVIGLFVGYFIALSMPSVIVGIGAVAHALLVLYFTITVKGALANFILGLINVQFIAMVAVFGIMALGIMDLIKNWDKLSGLQRTLAIIGIATIALTGLAIAIGAVQSAWSVGVAAFAIVAGIAAIATAMNNVGLKGGKSNFDFGSSGGFTTPKAPNVTNTDDYFNMYASGGFPEKGEMFIAQESGPEWVGNIGGRTAVMNQDQVVKSVLALVDKSTNALSNSRQEQSQVVNLYADDILLGKAVIKSINKTSLATGLTIK